MTLLPSPAVAGLRTEIEQLFGAAQPIAAQARIDQALRESPGDAHVLDLAATVLSSLGAHARALECADAAVALARSEAAILYTRGRVLKAAGRTADAVAAYRLVLAHQPEHLEALLSLGIALRARGQSIDAVEPARRFSIALVPPARQALPKQAD